MYPQKYSKLPGCGVSLTLILFDPIWWTAISNTAIGLGDLLINTHTLCWRLTHGAWGSLDYGFLCSLDYLDNLVCCVMFYYYNWFLLNYHRHLVPRRGFCCTCGGMNAKKRKEKKRTFNVRQWQEQWLNAVYRISVLLQPWHIQTCIPLMLFVAVSNSWWMIKPNEL